LPVSLLRKAAFGRLFLYPRLTGNTRRNLHENIVINLPEGRQTSGTPRNAAFRPISLSAVTRHLERTGKEPTGIEQ
jgi:hypothetical protein